MQEKNAMKPTRDALLERFLQAFPEVVIQVEDGAISCSIAFFAPLRRKLLISKTECMPREDRSPERCIQRFLRRFISC